jgi:penicillin amidase
MQHPFAMAVPMLSGWLNMPPVPLPGDNDMPRVQAPGFGASQRMVVTPGREEFGLMQMPGGQSGHPMSPFYRAGHDSWAQGTPASFLPGDTRYVLQLQPAVEQAAR